MENVESTDQQIDMGKINSGIHPAWNFSKGSKDHHAKVFGGQRTSNAHVAKQTRPDGKV